MFKAKQYFHKDGTRVRILKPATPGRRISKRKRTAARRSWFTNYGSAAPMYRGPVFVVGIDC